MMQRSNMRFLIPAASLAGATPYLCGVPFFYSFQRGVQRIQGKKFDEYGNRLRTNAQYKAAKKAKLYFANPKTLPFIDIARKAKKRMQGGSVIGAHRSEGREATCCTLEVLFLNMDVHTLRVGRPDAANKKEFHYPTKESLSSQAGLNPKRFQRQLELLKAAGVIGMSRRYEQLESGEYIGKASAIWFTRDFMKAFGMLDTFNRTSKQLTKRDKDHMLRDIKTPKLLSLHIGQPKLVDAEKIKK